MINPAVTEQLGIINAAQSAIDAAQNKIDGASAALAALVPALPDPRPKLTIHPATAQENDGFIVARITSDIPFPQDRTVFIETGFTGSADSTDVEPVAHAPITMVKDATETVYQFVLKNDAIPEATETFIARLLPGEGYDIAGAEAIMTILDTDVAVPPPIGEIVQTFADPPEAVSIAYTDTFIEVLVNGQNPNHIEVSGSVVLTCRGFRYAQSYDPLVGLLVRYLVDGVVVSPTVRADQPFTYSTTLLGDGSNHWITAEVIDGVGALKIYHPQSRRLIVANFSSPTGAQDVVVLGAEDLSNRLNGPRADVVHASDTVRHVAAAHPLPYRFSTPVHKRAIPPQLPILNNTLWESTGLVHTPSDLYIPSPEPARNANGRLTALNATHKSHDSVTDALDDVRRMAYPDGPRGVGAVSPYGQACSRAGDPGWIRAEIQGRITSIDGTGYVTTIFGPRLKDGVVPLCRHDTRISTQRLIAEQIEFVGTLQGGALPLDGIHDIRWLDAENLIGTASFTHYIFKLHVPTRTVSIYAGVPVPLNANGTKKPGAHRDGPVEQALFYLPYGSLPDRYRPGVVWVTDVGDDNGVHSCLRKIDNGVVTTVLDLTGKRGFVSRQFSDGHLLVIEQGLVNKGVPARAMDYDPDTGTYVELCRVPQARWIWGDVDWQGNIGVKDDFLVCAGTGGFGNVELRRFSRAGQTYGGAVEFYGTFGRLQMGHLTYVVHPMGHYPWDCAIHEGEAKVLTSGFGTMGLHQIRLYEPGEVKTNYDHQTYGAGMGVMRYGTVPAFGLYGRASFTCIRNQFGHGRLPVANFDDMAPELVNDQELGAYLVGGFGGNTPRPELEAEYWRKAAIAFIRANTLGQQGIVYPRKPAAKAIVLRDLRVSRSGTFVSLSYTTDEDTIGVIAIGAGNGAYHMTSPIESGWTRSHSWSLNLGTERARNLSVYLVNRLGQLARTGDQLLPGVS